MSSEKKIKKKCCHKFEKKGKHCKSCPENNGECASCSLLDQEPTKPRDKD